MLPINTTTAQHLGSCTLAVLRVLYHQRLRAAFVESRARARLLLGGNFFVVVACPGALPA
jgi:hypothetical protein